MPTPWTLTFQAWEKDIFVLKLCSCLSLLYKYRSLTKRQQLLCGLVLNARIKAGKEKWVSVTEFVLPFGHPRFQHGLVCVMFCVVDYVLIKAQKESVGYNQMKNVAHQLDSCVLLVARAERPTGLTTCFSTTATMKVKTWGSSHLQTKQSRGRKGSPQRPPFRKHECSKWFTPVLLATVTQPWLVNIDADIETGTLLYRWAGLEEVTVESFMLTEPPSCFVLDGGHCGRSLAVDFLPAGVVTLPNRGLTNKKALTTHSG